MSVSRHSVRVRALKKGDRVFMASISGMLPQIYVYSGANRYHPSVEHEYTYEHIQSSKVRDEYHNRDCFHTYMEMDALVGLGQLSGTVLTFKPNPGGYQYVEYYTPSTGVRANRCVPGQGTISSANTSMDVISNTPSYSKVNYYDSSRRHKSTLEWRLKKISSPNYSFEEVTFEYEYKITYSKWAHEEFGLQDIFISETFSTYQQGIGTMSADADISDVKLWLDRFYNRSIPEHIRPDNITDDLYDQLVIPNVNNCENLKDFRDIKKSLPPIVQLLKRRNIKSVAELYLWYKYSYSTTMMDIESYFKFFKNWLAQNHSSKGVQKIGKTYSSVHSDDSLSVTVNTTRYTIIIDTYNAGVLQALGLDLNLTNTWDMVPFSFVADWFINFGDILARVDHEDEISKLNVHTALTSTKSIQTCHPLGSLGCFDSCLVVRYKRDVSHSLPTGPISFSLKNPANHITDGLALYVATKRK